MMLRTRSLAGTAFVAAGLVMGALTVGLPRPAAAAVAIEGTFTARAECPAYQSFNSGTNPGGVTLIPGTVYGAFELNVPNGPWVRLRMPGPAPHERWVARECGRLEVISVADPPAQFAPAAPGPDVGAEAVETRPLQPSGPARLAPGQLTGPTVPPGPPLLPDTGLAQPGPRPGASVLAAPNERFPRFFDRIDQGPEDPTPPPPLLGEVDMDVLRLCGGWGAQVPPGAFRAFLDSHASLRDSLVATLRADLDTLIRAWTEADGFRHILCGEPDRRDGGRWSLGGMHYMGRYAQAQVNGWAGRLEGGCSVVEIAPPIYTEGVVFLAPDGTVHTKCVNGYAQGLTAPDILHEVTKAYRDAMRSMGPATGACRHRVLDDGSVYQAVFVMRDGAIRTFYPDATPDDSVPYCAP